MYGPTKPVGVCTSAKDYVKIVRGAGEEPTTGRKSTLHVPNEEVEIGRGRPE